MLKKHVVKFMVAVALFAAVTGSNVVSGVVGIEAVPSVSACGSSAGSGGSC
ncbi:MAG: hypothetical protein AAF629_04730 [Chloroflexota bacterium]